MNSGFGFIDFKDHQSAENALNFLNDYKLFEKDLKVNWSNSKQSESIGSISNPNQNSLNAPEPDKNGIYKNLKSIYYF